MTNTLPWTLFNRVNYLSARIPKQQMKDLGQLVRAAYFKKSNIAPTKLSLSVINEKGATVIRNVAVYPDEFLLTMDVLITNFAKQHKAKRKRFQPKYIPAYKPTKK